MDAHIIREQLFQKYIAPTRRKKKGYIGVEIEIPIINTKKILRLWRICLLIWKQPVCIEWKRMINTSIFHQFR